jgi:drug/metabolite transporter (DMT)-like permease
VVDLGSGAVLATASALNPQVHYGADIISRIAFARAHRDGAGELHEALRGGVRALVARCAEAADVEPATLRAVVAAGMPGLLAGVFLAGTFFFFIGSLTRTTVANTNILMSVSPFLAALAARAILKEPVPLRTWAAMLAAFAGIVVMFAQTADAGRLTGNLLALGVSCCFAAQLTVLRRFHATIDMLPQVMIAGVLSVAVAGMLAPSFIAPPRDLAILALMGCVQLGTGCLLATAASRHLSATELGLLALLEPILGPVWVWLLMDEHPGTATLFGGAIVLAAVFANEAFAAWHGRRPAVIEARAARRSAGSAR